MSPEFDLPFEPALVWLRAERTSDDGERWAWVVYDDVLLERWHASTDGRWERVGELAGFPNVRAAVADDPDLTALSPSQRTSYTLADPRDRIEILKLLHRTDGAGLGDDPADAWNEAEEDLSARLEDCDHVIVRADVDGMGVAFVRASATDVYRAVLFDDDEPVGIELARSAWGSEAGMTSGAGSISLILAAEDLGLSVGSGDDWQVPIAIFNLPGDPQVRAQAVTEWLTTVEHSQLGAVHGAALALEPLDPQNALAGNELERWTAALQSQEVEATFSLGENVAAELRVLLGRDETYRSIRNGLAQPQSDAGKRLLTALTDGDLTVTF